MKLKQIVLGSLVLGSISLYADLDKYEVVIPTIGKNFTDSSSKLEDKLIYGVKLNRYLTDDIIGQIGYEKIDEVDINRFSANLLKEFSYTTNLKPYILGGLGYEKFLNNKNQGFLNYGFGLKYIFNETLSFITEVKSIHKLDTNDNDFVLSAGLGIKFGETENKIDIPVVENIITDCLPGMNCAFLHKKKKSKKVIKKIVKKVCAKPKDSDNDGIFDRFDECQNTPSGYQVNSDGCINIFKFNINFNYKNTNLRNEDMANINKFVKFLKTYPNYNAEIQGHTDSVGSEAYNKKLSLKRANTVMNIIITMGIDKDRLTAKGYGENYPIITNSTEWGRAENRRVEAHIQIREKDKQ